VHQELSKIWYYRDEMGKTFRVRYIKKDLRHQNVIGNGAAMNALLISMVKMRSKA
jgi:hypothetical protein